MAYFSSMRWADVVAVGIRTTADGPFSEDVFWQFLLRDGFIEVPGQAVDSPAFDELCTHLPGMDFAKIKRAMTSTAERIFRVWHHQESKFQPSREDLAARFRALVEKLGGNGEAAPQVFDALYTAWSGDARRYHDVEHLVDCLREVDDPSAELALWYHDVVYLPGGHDCDCEERSALALLRDATRLGIPEAIRGASAAMVRATAHAGGRVVGAADLVVDIDLSILGRDPLRFMDYEYGVQEEYAAIPVAVFRSARGRFLAALLERPNIFQTEQFRLRFEEPARANISALLARYEAE
jgi:predicted metal-dependent HD superfamily phosphohydrolase